ncbi:MAG: hypothetical protein Q4F30_08875 [Akkermansia sp.]|nr:hypothetical protein [Akkermansia sp.]
MKKTLTTILAALAVTLPGHAAIHTYMLRGVTESKGWYDADKSGPADNQMCWAASAANMIAWWQDRNADTHGQTNAPKGNAVWETMKKSFGNTPGSPMAATNWWFSKAINPKPRSIKDDSNGGYYGDIISGKKFSVDLHQGPSFGSQLSLSERLKELIVAGNGMCVGIQRVNGTQIQGGGHMISLWGIDFDEDKKVVTRVYLSDSDDALGYSARMQKGLFVADCTWREDLTFGGQPYPTLLMDTESPWFDNNAVITSIVTFSGNNEFITDKDREDNAKEDEAQAAREAKSVGKKAKKSKGGKKDKKADTAKDDKKAAKEKKKAEKAQKKGKK